MTSINLPTSGAPRQATVRAAHEYTTPAQVDAEIYIAIRQSACGGWVADTHYMGQSRRQVQEQLDMDDATMPAVARSRGEVIAIVRTSWTITVRPEDAQRYHDEQTALSRGMCRLEVPLTEMQKMFAQKDWISAISAEYGIDCSTLRDAVEGGSNV